MRKMNLLKSHKKQIVTLLVLLLLGVAGILFVQNDESLYEETIGRVTKVEETIEYDIMSTSGIEENLYLQKLTVLLQNGEKKGTIIQVTNRCSDTGINDNRYKVKDQLFIRFTSQGDPYIDGVKRDGFLAVAVVCFLILLFLVGGKRGFPTVLSVLLNIGISIFAVNRLIQGESFLVFALLVTTLFVLVTLPLAGGIGKKSLAGICGTLISTVVAMLLAVLVIFALEEEGLNYELMDFLTFTNERELFLVQILLGALGAVMDISITMSASVSELCRQNPAISRSALVKSGTAIGADVMGTMLNVLFFTYMSGSIPLMILWMKNQVSLEHIITRYLPLEIARAATGAISIVVSIPICLFVSIGIFKHKAKGGGGK